MTNTEVDTAARIHAEIQTRAKRDLESFQALFDQERQRAGLAFASGGYFDTAQLDRMAVRTHLTRMVTTMGLPTAIDRAMAYRDAMVEAASVAGLAVARVEASAARSWLGSWEDEIIEALPHLGPETQRRILSTLISGV